MIVGVDVYNYYPRLKDLREDRDFSQQFIAEFLGMKQSQYSRYERGLRDIPTDVLIRLADLYKTSTDYILGRTNHTKPYENK
ncbi:MAG: helix-turn-helix transcriptional regulator [Ruminococcaceae bacterium]|nr:helix-turn-helix transcriptional regulator [Oscillospiraceae bacterium]